MWATGFGEIVAAQGAAPNEPLLGTINFPTSGAEEAQQRFRLGVLALHSFWYPQARDNFLAAQELPPPSQCS